MRIIAGKWRGRKLVSPPGLATRPTSDRVREALFSMLASRLGSFEGLRVADLFAGSGALGLEALSRGAAHCTFVEKDRAAIDAIRANVAALGADADILTGAAEHARIPVAANLAFLDPPYGTGLAQAALDRVAEQSWLAPGGWISVELHGETLEPPSGLAIAAERHVGKATILLVRAEA